jgi:hypothetical protein
MNSSNIPANRTTYKDFYPSTDEKLTKFLCLATEETVLPKSDVEAFKMLICKNNHSLIEFIANLNPDNIIRLFFPNTQLSRTNIEFLKKTTFVFRRPAGLFNYAHGRHQTRTRHQYSMNFFMLYLLLNYDATFRKMSVANSHADGTAINIGHWHDNFVTSLMKSGDNADFTIEIIPPKSSDISTILQELFSINLLADDFALPINYDANNQLEMKAYNLRSTLYAMRIGFKNLSANIQNVLKDAYIELNINSSAASKEERVESSYSDNALTRNLPDALAAMITESGKTITIKKIQHTSADSAFYNMVFMFCLFALSKNKETLVASKAQESVYKNLASEFLVPDPLPAANTSLTTWLYALLSHSVFFPLEDIFDECMFTYREIIERHECPFLPLDIGFFTISKELFDNVFTGRVLTFFKEAFVDVTLFQKKIKERTILHNTSSYDLLQEFLAGETPEPEKKLYIRKFITAKSTPLTLVNLEKEFNREKDPAMANVLKVRPATFIVPTLTIETYQGDWRSSSGVLIMTPPDDSISMAGFKRPAYSNALCGKVLHSYGFPMSTEEALRPAGGKPSYNEKDFFRQMLTLNSRYNGSFHDMSRKDFYLKCFIDYKQPVINGALTEEELDILSGKKVYDTTQQYQDAFIQLYNFYKFVAEQLSGLHACVRDYYLQLFIALVFATEAHKPLSSTLKKLIVKSKNRKLIAIDENFYLKSQNLSLRHKNIIANNRHTYSLSVVNNSPEDVVIMPSNEALLQGLRAVESKTDDNHSFVPYSKEFTRKEKIQIELIKRHGNYVAIFVNVASDTSDQINFLGSGSFRPSIQTGLISAWIIYFYLQKYFNQDLPFAVYAHESGSFMLHTAVQFKKLFPSSWDYSNRLFNKYIATESENTSMLSAIKLSNSLTATAMTTTFSLPGSPSQNRSTLFSQAPISSFQHSQLASSSSSSSPVNVRSIPGYLPPVPIFASKRKRGVPFSVPAPAASLQVVPDPTLTSAQPQPPHQRKRKK